MSRLARAEYAALRCATATTAEPAPRFCPCAICGHQMLPYTAASGVDYYAAYCEGCGLKAKERRRRAMGTAINGPEAKR